MIHVAAIPPILPFAISLNAAIIGTVFNSPLAWKLHRANYMRVLLINVHHPSIGSSIADHLPPLGLLAIGGPLIDDGHEVRLIDGELGPMPDAELVVQAVAFAPEIIMFGHSGSTSAHPVIAGLSRRLRARLPQVAMIYGG